MKGDNDPGAGFQAPLHRLLRRQLGEHGLAPAIPPADRAAWERMLQAVSETYRNWEREQEEIDRALVLATEEMESTLRELRCTNESQLGEERMRLRATIAAVSEGLATIDGWGRLLSLNPAGERLLGRSADELRGQDFLQILNGSSFDSRSALQAGVPFRVEEVLYSKPDGELLPITFAFDPIRKNGQNLGGVVVFRDVSAEVERTQALESARDVAETASRAKSEFLANMSHEIRTPLNGVVGIAHLLSETGLDATQEGYVATLKSSAETLLSLINDVLDFSKIEACRFEIEQIEFDLLLLFEEVLLTFAQPVAEKGLRLAPVLSSNLPRQVVGDPLRLRQILTNLIANAVKFTARGHVSVHARKLIEGPDYVDVGFRVVDTGIGLRQDPEELFEAFTQADSSTTRRYGGTGLGLAICKELATLMGGEIGAEGTEGLGSTFWFTVRLGRPTTKPEVEPRLPRRRVLVVHGYGPEGELLGEQLATWGLAPEIRSDLVDAAKTIGRATREQRPFELVFLDLESLGLRATGWVRALHEKVVHAPPVIGLVPFGKGGDAPPHGISATIERPWRAIRLFNTCARSLGFGQAGEFGGRGAKGAAPPELGPVRPDAEGGRRVLLVEDNRVNQLVARRLLEKEGLEVSVANNGVEALHRIQHEDYDLVIMDCQMPEMDGFEATATIREREVRSGKRLPIVALTANAVKGDRERCLEAGMDDYLSKPIDVPTLRHVLARWLGTAVRG